MPKLTKGQKAGIGFIVGLAALVAATRAKAAPPLPYCCPYCGDCFATLEELQTHVAIEHPGERIPIDIIWD